MLDSMQHVDIRSHNYGQMEVAGDFNNMDGVPPPPPDGQVAAAWYDTDL